MPSPEYQIAYSITLRVEEAFVAFLRTVATDPDGSGPLAGIDLNLVDVVCASNREVTVGPLHVFVLCNSVTPLLPSGPIYKADVRVVVVTNIDDQTHAIRRALTEKVLSKLTSVTSYEHFVQVGDAPEVGLSLKGWSILEMKDISTDQQTADALVLTVGVWAASGEPTGAPASVG